MNIRYDPMLNWVKSRIDRNKNCIIVINGATGSGKTYAGIRFCQDIAKMLGTSFNIKDNLDFKFGELLKKMGLEENQTPGTPFLFEEVGVIGGGAASRDWQSKANRFFHAFMQTSRHRQQVLVMTCPSFGYLDKGARELCHTQLEMTSIDFTRSKSYAKPYLLQVNRRSSKIYFKYLRFKENKIHYKLTLMEFGLPEKKIRDEYENMKMKYTKDLTESIINADKPKERVEKQKYPHKCINCGHEWESEHKNPQYCRKCRRFGVISKENEVLKGNNPNSNCNNLISSSHNNNEDSKETIPKVM